MAHQPPLVQLALDYPTIEEALAMAEIGIRAGVDILEAGTPLIVSQGVSAIGRLARAFPDYPILADYKTMDSGGKNVLITKQQGGHYMTVCANSPDETVQAAIAAGKETGIHVVTDLIGVKNQADRARQCAEWGIDWIYLHYGADQWRKDASRDSTQWLREILDAVSTPIGVGTFDVSDGIVAAEGGADLVCIGHPLIDANPLEALTRYVQEVKARHRPRR